MTATAIPTRMLVLLGAVVAAAAAFLVARPLLLSDDDSGSTSSVATPTPAKPAATPAKPPATTKTAPKVVILPIVPNAVAKKLRFSKVVVVPVYSGTSKSDRAAVAQARQGARKAGSGFVALNVLDERTARELQPFAGTASSPAVLVVKRPGKIVNRFDTRVDAELVAQAARNAGAGK